jgi:hypothetical protein
MSTLISSPKSSRIKPNNLNLASITSFDNSINSGNQHRRYKKEHVSKDYKAICMSPISKLSDRVGKLFTDTVSKDDFYRILLKNDIDPDSKSVSKILSNLEMETNKSHKDIVSQLLRAKGTKSCINLEADTTKFKSPIKQTMTSFEANNLKGGDIQMTITSKRKFDNTQFNTSTQIFAKQDSKIQLKKNNTEQTLIKSPRTRDLSLNSSLTHKSKKIGFMTQSSIFSGPSKDEINSINENLANKYAGSILHNFSSKRTFEAQRKSDSSLNIDNIKSRSGMKYKNQVSDMNAVAKLKKPDSANTQIKIVGLIGKSKVNTEADQSKSTIGNLMEWKIKKTKHDFPATINDKQTVDLERRSSEMSMSSQKTASTQGNGDSQKMKSSGLFKEKKPQTKTDKSVLALLKN